MTTDRTRIKFCGLQAHADVRLCEELGVDAIGFIFAPSPRRISLELASNLAIDLSPATAIFAVVVDPTEAEAEAVRAALPRAVFQFCGDETPDRCAHLAGDLAYVKATDGRAYRADAPEPAVVYPPPAMLLLDGAAGGARGGTGVALPWETLRPPDRAFFLAGGLTSENVGEAIRVLRPYGVDVRSGIESEGRKDAAKMRAFVAAVRRADEERLHATR